MPMRYPRATLEREMSKKRLIPIVVVVALVAVVGLNFLGVVNFAGMVGLGPKEKVIKVSPEPIAFEQPFVVNLADTDDVRYIKLGVAVELEPMSEEQLHMFDNGAGGHGGASKTGRMKVGTDPELRDVVINTTAQFTSEELLTPEGKDKLKHDMLKGFEKVAAKHEHAREEHHKAMKDNPAIVAEPPYHIADVFFSEYTLQ